MTPPFLFNATSLDEWRDALGTHGWNILVILVIVVVAEFVLRKATGRLFRAVTNSAALRRPEDRAAIQQRADTLASTVLWVMRIILFFVGLTLVLDEIGISVTALVAGVGVVGIAIGLGAQALVRDVINGTFILVEDQYRVGDVVTVANVSGTVLEINPRRTVIRDADGNVHSIPNGAISVSTNQTAGFSRLNLDIPVTYAADLDRVFQIIEEEATTLREERPGEILSSALTLRVAAFQENRVLIKIMGDVVAGKHWDLSAQLRRRIKTRLDAEGLWMAGAPPVPAPVTHDNSPQPRVEPDEATKILGGD